MTTTFKDTIYLTCLSLYIALSVVTLGLLYFIFNSILPVNPMVVLYEKFYGREMPKFKAESNGESVRILIKQKFKPWREPHNYERHYSMGLGLPKHNVYNSSIQERANQEIYLVKKYFEMKQYKEIQLIYNTDIFRSLSEDSDEDDK